MNRFIAFILFTMLSSTLMAEQILLDRLIVEINGKSYSQKQLEVYNLLRTIAMGEETRQGLPAATQWADQVETFKNEMIVYTQLENDQQKLDSFLPDSKKIEGAEKALNSAQAKDKEIDQFIRQRQLSESDISRVLTIIYRVEAYAQNRLQLSAAKTNDANAFVRIDPKADWFVALLKTTSYRYYFKAKDYKVLAPFRS